MVQKALELPPTNVRNRSMFLTASKDRADKTQVKATNTLQKMDNSQIAEVCGLILRGNFSDPKAQALKENKQEQLDLALYLRFEHTKPAELAIIAEGTGLVGGVYLATTFLHGQFQLTDFIPAAILGFVAAYSSAKLAFSRINKQSKRDMIEFVVEKLLKSDIITDDNAKLVLESCIANKLVEKIIDSC